MIGYILIMIRRIWIYDHMEYIFDADGRFIEIDTYYGFRLYWTKIQSTGDPELSVIHCKIYLITAVSIF